MSNQTQTQLTSHVERARKVLYYEQRGNHLDKVVRGGLELFAVRWADDVSAICKSAGLDLKPIHRFTEHLEGYRQQDPMQRAASLRAALAILNELESGEHHSEDDLGRPESGQRGRPESGQPELPGRPRGAPVPYTENDEPSYGTGDPRGRPGPVRSDTENVGPSYSRGDPRGRPGSDPIRPGPIRPASDPIHLEAGMSASHAALTLLSADVTAVPGVGPSVAAKLRGLGIRTVRDLLFYFPRQHRDYSKLTKIANIPFGEVTTTLGLIWEVETVRTAGGRTRTIATISDETGKIRVSWFNQAYLQKQLQAAKGEYLVVTGTKRRFGNKVEFNVQSHELPERGDLLSTGRLVPIYPLTEGLHAKTLRRFTKWVVDRYASMIPEHLPASIRGKLLTLPEAVSQIHYPESEEMLKAARRRLGFDELFMIHLGMQERRSRWQHEAPQGNALTIDFKKIFIDTDDLKNPTQAADHDQNRSGLNQPGTTLWSSIATDKPFEATLPFRFTDAQRRVIIEIFSDLSQNRSMCRLLQGDVGAGKTAVAAATLLMAALNGYQGAIMAPTELLAEQHARSIGDMLEPFGIRTVLMTGSLRTRERAMGRAAIETGQAMVAVGTHALIQEDVTFQKLGLVIVDEQHRFGVEQRDILRQKGYHPHMLVMTATPIPRTLALTIYGDLDVSVIDKLPPGRQKIISRWRTGARRDEAYKLIAQQVEEGRQAFIICPLIEESETLAVKSATAEYERLSRDVFPHLRLGLLHGSIKASDKDAVMRRFRDGELDILVATSVIEVGIDIPNATVMVIEDADRFGLSQLHQFRGRVGRGEHQSYCYILSADSSMQAQERLEVFQHTDDGFRLSEEDLRLRGPGDFFGVRQSGVPELRIADLSDTPLIEHSRSLAAKLWESDPYLRKPEHMALREKMHLFWQNMMAH